MITTSLNSFYDHLPTGPFLVDIAIKAPILFLLTWFCGRWLDRVLPKASQGKKSMVLFMEILFQVSVMTALLCIYETVLEAVFDALDFFPPSISREAWGYANLFTPFALFNTQANLDKKICLLRERNVL